MASLSPIGPGPAALTATEPFSESYKSNLNTLRIRFQITPSYNNAIAIAFCYYTLIDHLYSEESTAEMHQFITKFTDDKPQLRQAFSPFSPILENFNKLSKKIESFLTGNPISVYSS